MLVRRTLDLPASSKLVLRELDDLSSKELSDMVSDATAAGEAILEKTGLPPLDIACQCHFGAQVGCQVNGGEFTSRPLRWWNDRSRSLTPGFIGEIRVRAIDDDVTELSAVGQYYPRAHLYELVDPDLLAGMAKAVVSSFVERLGDWISKVPTARTPAALHAVVS